MGREWDRFREDDPATSRNRGERAGEHGRIDAEQKTAAGGVRVEYGGGKRPTTSRCTGCGKRDQFRKDHDCAPGARWAVELIDPHAAPPSMLAFQSWCREWARLALRALRPGGHLLAFGGTRTYHRMAAGVEDAGFEVRDQLQWLYGQGFPKSLDVGKAIDAAAPRRGMFEPFARHYGERRRATGLTHAEVCAAIGAHGAVNHGGASVNWERGYNVPTVAQWSALAGLLGLSGEWGPLIEREEAERERIGQRDGSALAVAPGQGEDRGARVLDVTAPATPDAERWQGWGTALKPAHEPIVVARKPLAGTVAANVLAHGTGALNVDGCRIEGSWAPKGAESGLDSLMVHDNGKDAASRADIMFREKPERQSHEAGRWPANVVLDPEAAAMLDEQTGEMKSPAPYARSAGTDTAIYGDGLGRVAAGAVDVNYGDTGGASRFFYCAKASSAERNAMELSYLPRARSPRKRRHQDLAGTWRERARNRHPTVKPVDVMRWLVRLVTPPGGLVVDPFAGSGTTGCAAMLEGRRFLGIERDHGSAIIARARIAWWADHPDGMELVRRLELEAERAAVVAAGQEALF